MALLDSKRGHRRWIQTPHQSYDPRQDTYANHHRVGASPQDYAAQGVGKADAYTYGAASAAMSEAQAMAAWAELQKQQNYPEVKAIASKRTCPPGWLISPDLQTCVNQDNVHIAMGDSATCAVDTTHGGGWYYCAALPSYLRLNEAKSLQGDALPNYADASLRGLRAMRMTTGNYGWTNVKSQLRAVAWMYVKARGDSISDVDEVAEKLEATIGPLYDADQANPPATETKSSAIIANLIYRAHASGGKLPGSSGGSGSGYLVPLAIGAAALAVFAPGVALGAAAGIWAGTRRAGSYVFGKAKGVVT